MFINYEMATIEITKAEAKAAGIFKSAMYDDLTEARTTTGFKVVVKEETRRKKDTMKGLTYAYMTLYIKTKFAENEEKKDELLKELNDYRGCVNGKRDILKEKAAYGEVKAWFLEQFPEITEFNNKLNEKRKNAREAREMKRLEKLFVA